MTDLYRTFYQSPIGRLEIEATDAAIVAVRFADDADRPETTTVSAVMQACIRQLDEYFRAERTEFDLPLDFRGTPFQRRVWRALCDIPFGQTVSYAEVARQVENPKAVRAVGHANGQNPIVIIAPCHRVVGSNGKLTGYGGGLWRKKWLLAHESGGQQSRNSLDQPAS